MKAFARVALALTAATALLAASALLRAAEPQGDTRAHDPTLWVGDDGVWHVFTTGPGLQRLRSADGGATWQRQAPLLRAAPAWWAEAVPAHRGLDAWAPKLFKHAGRLWVLYSISTFGSNTSAIGLASVDDKAGADADAADWRDDGRVVASHAGDDFNAIDPDLMRDRSGRLWLSYGSFWNGIRLTELDATTMRPVGDTRFIARHAGGIEAPTLVQHGDAFYLFVSQGYCCRGVASTYEIRVGRATQVQGPYLDREGRALLDGGGTLIETGGTRWKGPGHQDVVGDLIVRHAYDAQDNGQSHLRIGHLTWSADGWPSLAQQQ